MEIRLLDLRRHGARWHLGWEVSTESTEGCSFYVSGALLPLTSDFQTRREEGFNVSVAQMRRLKHEEPREFVRRRTALWVRRDFLRSLPVPVTLPLANQEVPASYEVTSCDHEAGVESDGRHVGDGASGWHRRLGDLEPFWRFQESTASESHPEGQPSRWGPASPPPARLLVCDRARPLLRDSNTGGLRFEVGVLVTRVGPPETDIFR